MWVSPGGVWELPWWQPAEQRAWEPLPGQHWLEHMDWEDQVALWPPEDLLSAQVFV